MGYIGIDLGSTNCKVALYNDELGLIKEKSNRVKYETDNKYVEINIDTFMRDLFGALTVLIKGCREPVHAIGLTGQAETLVVLNRKKQPVMRAVSWMDNRSEKECEDIEALFEPEVYHAHTGQMSVQTTWPVTKIAWLKNHEPDVFHEAAYYVLLKDYVVYVLTGILQGEMSIATFSSYFDIYHKCYWKEMLDKIGIDESRLPPLAEPNTVVGNTKADVCGEIGLEKSVPVINGTLDHFAAMIGTGNMEGKQLSLSIGTVAGLAMRISGPVNQAWPFPMHYGYVPDTRVALSVIESGGVSLDWFSRITGSSPGFEGSDKNAPVSERRKWPFFLPQIVGVNPPDYSKNTKGVFAGLDISHDVYSMTGSIMEGVAHILRQNIELMREGNEEISGIIMTGGGTKSAYWTQLITDVTGLTSFIPENKEAARLGAAIAAAVETGGFSDYKEACELCVSFERVNTPKGDEYTEARYRKYIELHRAAAKLSFQF